MSIHVMLSKVLQNILFPFLGDICAIVNEQWLLLVA